MGNSAQTTSFPSIATRMTTSIGAAALAAAALATPARPAGAEVGLLADATALVLCGTTCPTPDATYIDIVKNQYIAPTHPGQDIDYVPVTAPMELWPATGVFRLLGLALGDPRLFGPGGPAWPDEPLWKLSGLFDLTAAQTVEVGAADLEAAIAEQGNQRLVIYGLSQGAGVANVVKKNLAARFPAGTEAPAIDFVLSGDPNLPNGGLMSRFAGAYIPILDFPFNGPAATGTEFTTVEINRQYDGFSDFPLYPLNLVADLNAVMGILYLHTNFFDVGLPPDPTTSPAFQGSHGDSSFYFFETKDLPLFSPLRRLGVPEKLIDVIEPVVRVLVELGYDRSIPPWEPAKARLIPPLRDPAQVAGDLRAAIREGIDTARTLMGSRTLQETPSTAQGADPASVNASHSLDVAQPARDSATKAPAPDSAPGPNGRNAGTPTPITPLSAEAGRPWRADSSVNSRSPERVEPQGKPASRSQSGTSMATSRTAQRGPRNGQHG